MFGTATPGRPNVAEGQPVTLGLRFHATRSGTITGVRFYKNAQNTGTHVGRLWAADGQLLATATFAGETASGWQTASFPTPVPVTAGTTYVVSYHTPTGNYSADNDTFAGRSVTSGPLDRPCNPARRPQRRLHLRRRWLPDCELPSVQLSRRRRIQRLTDMHHT